MSGVGGGGSILCPRCYSPTRVTLVNFLKKADTLRRLRVCSNRICNHHLYTAERVIDATDPAYPRTVGHTE